MTGKYKEKIVSGDGDEDNVGFGRFEAIERPNIDETLNKLKKEEKQAAAAKKKQKPERAEICCCGVVGCRIGPMKYVDT